MEVREQFSEIESLLLLCGCQRLDSGCQVSHRHLYLLNRLDGLEPSFTLFCSSPHEDLGFSVLF